MKEGIICLVAMLVDGTLNGLHRAFEVVSRKDNKRVFDSFHGCTVSTQLFSHLGLAYLCFSCFESKVVC